MKIQITPHIVFIILFQRVNENIKTGFKLEREVLVFVIVFSPVLETKIIIMANVGDKVTKN